MADETTTTDAGPQGADMVTGLVDRVLDMIDRAREVGTENAVRAVRALVFGLVAMIFVIASVIFFVVVLVRLADAYLPIGTGVGDATWAAHLYIGGTLSIFGFGFWVSRKSSGMARLWIALIVNVVIAVAIIAYAIAS